MSDIYDLDSRIVACRLCPRLVAWRERVAAEKRRAFAEEVYWGKAVPNFGDPEALRLIVGLAPAAHGANRTGRMFTGDRSGDWLFRALHAAGLANQPTSESRDDGLILRGALITAVVHCAPPDNQPRPSEFAACRPYFEELLGSRKWESILCLGGISWRETLRRLRVRPLHPFGHGASVVAPGGTRIVGCYHPSQQNTFTGRLTEPMLAEAIRLWLA